MQIRDRKYTGVENLSLSLNGKKILKNVSLEVWKGYIRYIIVKPNGAGLGIVDSKQLQALMARRFN